MKYTVNGVEYNGFCRASTPRIAKAPEVVIAWFDGEPELWYTDGSDEAFHLLCNLYDREWGAGRTYFERATMK